MFKVNKHDEITRIVMGSKVNGRIIFTVSAYLVDGLLIDTGSHNTRWELVDYLSNRNIAIAVNTHHHVDHIGANKLIMERLRTPVFASKGCVPIIARKQDIFPFQEELWGCPEPCRVETLGDTVETSSYSFKVIATAGHTTDHVVFFSREKGWLFTGDEFLTEKPNSARINENNERIVLALEKMLALEPELLFTSAGGIYQRGSVILSRTINYFEEIKHKAHNLKKSGLNSKAIAFKLFGEETSMRDYTLGVFSHQNFIEGFFRDSGESECR